MMMCGTPERLVAGWRFGRLDLIGKGDSKQTYQSGQYYALALTGFNEKNPVDGPTTMVDDVTNEVFQVTTRDLTWLMNVYEEQGAGSRAAVNDLEGRVHSVRVTDRFAKPAPVTYDLNTMSGEVVTVMRPEYEALQRAFDQGMEVCDVEDIYGDSWIIDLNALFAPSPVVEAAAEEAVIPVITYEWEGGEGQEVGDRGFAAILADGMHVGRIPWAKMGISTSHQENTIDAVKEWAWRNYPAGFILPYQVGQGDGYVTELQELKPWMCQNMTFDQAVAALAKRAMAQDQTPTADTPVIDVALEAKRLGTFASLANQLAEVLVEIGSDWDTAEALFSRLVSDKVTMLKAAKNEA